MGRGMKTGVAEFIGTFALCFIGQGSIIVAHRKRLPELPRPPARATLPESGIPPR